MEKTATYQIGLDTPIHMLTPRQLFEMQMEWMEGKVSKKEENEPPQSWYVNSMADLAKILGTSVPTLYRMKKEGLLDDVMSQYGTWVCIDVNAVIEKFRLSNRKRLVKMVGRVRR